MTRSAEMFLSRLWLGNRRMSLRPTRVGSPVSMLAAVAGVAGLLFSGACLGGASAQSAVVIDNNGAELQTLYATPDDIAEGKVLAETSCAACHGASGISETPQVPHLAGQRSAYLYIALKAYQADTRGENPMSSQVKFLSND